MKEFIKEYFRFLKLYGVDISVIVGFVFWAFRHSPSVLFPIKKKEEAPSALVQWFLANHTNKFRSLANFQG